MHDQHEIIIARTKKWIETVVIGLNFCPFAAREMRRNSIRYIVCNETIIEKTFQCLRDECTYLDDNNEAATTLIIFPRGFDDFFNYLDLIEAAENAILIEDDYEGIYQFASFHPDYLFDASEPDDPANFTNRSPYPMIHILREESLDAAIENYDGADEIPEKNMALARKKGLAVMKALRDACLK